jgi:hypothetical protein
MKLSDLVTYRNQLDALSSVPTLHTANYELDKVLHLVSTQPELMTSMTHDLDQQYANIQQAFVKFEDDLNNLKSQLSQKIEIAERPWFQESYTLYEGELMQAAESVLNLRKPNTLDTEPFQIRLSQYANWKYPALIIRPGLETFIENMVAYDPLYLVDLSHDYLAPAMNRFNEQYQNRLRPYVVREDLDQDILAKIPNDQFGMCLVYHLFNFRPLEIIKRCPIACCLKIHNGPDVSQNIRAHIAQDARNWIFPIKRMLFYSLDQVRKIRVILAMPVKRIDYKHRLL